MSGCDYDNEDKKGNIVEEVNDFLLHGRTPLHRAASDNTIVDAIKIFNDTFEARDNSGATPLISAAAKLSLETIKFLLQKGVNVNAKDGKGRTALHHAAGAESKNEDLQVGVIEALIQAGANVNALDAAKESALVKASRLWSGYNAKDCDCDDPGPARVWAALCQAGADANVVLVNDPEDEGRKGMPILDLAAFNQNCVLVDILLKHGADVGAKSTSRFGLDKTALHSACNVDEDERSIKTVRRLLDAKADPDAADKFGETPLHYAFRRQSKKTVKMLLEAGASMDIANSRGETPRKIKQNLKGLPNLHQYAKLMETISDDSSDEEDRSWTEGDDGNNDDRDAVEAGPSGVKRRKITDTKGHS